MTEAEAIERQKRLAEHYDLSFWYGTKCRKCCSVYPKFMTLECSTIKRDCWYECEVCGRKTHRHEMPYLARDEWNGMDFEPIPRQMTIFEFM